MAGVWRALEEAIATPYFFLHFQKQQQQIIRKRTRKDRECEELESYLFLSLSLSFLDWLGEFSFGGGASYKLGRGSEKKIRRNREEARAVRIKKRIRKNPLFSF
ncbi:MAG: hypothetical protein JO131_07280 [Gammaproteobacteria bacterium]|nr:hypothetical protein [Gammaproteobacteria bacterium]